MKKIHFWGVVMLLLAYMIGARYPALAKKIGVA